MSIETIRLDKWLWYARFFKTRTLAAKICKSGKIRVNQERINKANQRVKRGDVLTFSQGKTIRVVRVIEFGNRRGPACEARGLYEDLQPMAKSHNMEEQKINLLQGIRSPGSGRPTKSERRAIDKLMGWFKGR